MQEGFSFTVHSQLNKARLTTLTTPHGAIEGPFFQFVATQAAIRGMVFAEDLEALGVQIVLANTYHLHVRPGDELVAAAGDLHQFMQWEGPITTDSGGYQVFSLGQHVRLDADGVTFRSPLNGDLIRFTPASVMEIEANLGADLIMPLDVCTPFGASEEAVAEAVAQTSAWAALCKATYEEIQTGRERKQMLYGIVQGGLFPELRKKSAAALQEIGFDGYAIGGELRDATGSRMSEGIGLAVPHLPAEAPRYLMGVGTPADIVDAVRQGVDHFDCVLPIRNARHGKLYAMLNEDELRACVRDPERPIIAEQLHETIDIRRSRWAKDFTPFSSGNPAIRKDYSWAYVHHLLKAEAPSGMRLVVLHNIYFYVQLMAAIRRIIQEEAG